MKQEEIIKKAYDIFSSFERPSLFTRTGKGDSDPESMEHDEALKGTTRETLSIPQIGPLGYSPVPLFTPEAMAYFLPRLIEFAVRNVEDSENEPYIVRFINLTLDGPNQKQFQLLKGSQKKIVFQALLYAKEKYYKIIEDLCWAEALDSAIGNWAERC